MSDKLKYTRTRHRNGYTVWGGDEGYTRYGEVRKNGRPGKTSTWTAWYDGEPVARPGSDDTHFATRERAAETLVDEHNRRWSQLPQRVVLHLASHTDYITDDGTELTKRPYPFAMDAKGNILGSREDDATAVGFQNNVGVQRIDLDWSVYIKGDLNLAVGKYLVTRAANGRLFTQVSAIEWVDVQ